MWAVSCALKLLDLLPNESTILDIGSGDGEHAEMFRYEGMRVTSIDLSGKADIRGDYMKTLFPHAFDCIWASHVLEHQRNPGEFLDKVRWDLKDGGLLAVTVPPRKDEIVGGHVTLWNAGLLVYNLVLAGFDCSRASVLTEGYNVSVIARKRLADLPDLTRDHGDIERLSEFFPFPVKEGFDGIVERVNW